MRIICKKYCDKILNQLQQKTKKKELVNMKKSLDILNSIRSLDDNIIIDESYTKFILEIQNRVEKIGKEIKEYTNKVKKGEDVQYKKLYSRLQIFGNLKWIDQYFSQDIVGHTYQKVINCMSEYVHELGNLCQKYYNEKKFDNLAKILQNFIELSKLSMHVKEADSAYKETEQSLKTRIMESLENSKYLYINLDIKKPLITQWLPYNQNIEYLNEIKKLPANLKLDLDKINTKNKEALSNYFTAISGKILGQKSENLIQEADKWNAILDSLKNFGSYDSLKNIIIDNFDSHINRLFKSIENYYDELSKTYSDLMRQNNMQIAQQQYEYLKDISLKFTFNIQQLSEKFRNLSNPYDKITLIIKDVRYNVKLRDFQSILDSLEILKNLTGVQDKQQYQQLIQTIQKDYSERVDRITKQIRFHQSGDRIMQYSFQEQIKDIQDIHKYLKEHLGVPYLKSMNKKIVQEFEELFSTQEKQVTNLLNDRKYLAMEQEYNKYKILSDFVAENIPTDILGESQIKQQQHFYTNSESSQSNIAFKNQQEGKIQQQVQKNFVKRFQFFSDQLTDLIEKEQFTQEKFTIIQAKQTLDNLHKANQKCKVFNQLFKKCYSGLIQYYQDKLKQQFESTYQSIQKNDINQSKQYLKDIQSQVQQLDPHIKQSDINNQIQNAENKIQIVIDKQKNQLQEMIDENKYDQVNEQLNKIQKNDIDTFQSQINGIFTRVVQDIQNAEKCAKQNDYTNLTQLVQKINGVLTIKHHLGEEQKNQLRSKYTNLQTEISQAIVKFIQLFHKQYVEQIQKFQENDVIKFLEIFKLINKLTQLGSKTDSIKKQIETIELDLCKKIKDLYNSYVSNINQLNFEGIDKNLKDSQILTTVIRNIKSLDDQEIASSNINIDLYQICKQCLLYDEIYKQVQEKVSQLIQNSNILWEKKKYQDLAFNLRQIKDSLQLRHIINELSANWDMLLKNIAKQIKDQSEDVLQKIKVGQFKGLNEEIKQIYQSEEALSGIQGLYKISQKENVKKTALKYIQAKLKSQDFKNIQSFGQNITEVKKIENDVPVLKQLIHQQLSQIIRDFAKENGNEGVFKLAHHLQNEEDPADREIVNSHREFKNVNIANINKQAKVTIKEALENFKTKENDKDIQLDKTLLRQFYDSYKDIYDQLIEKYKNQLKNIKEIPSDVRNKIQNAKISIQNWNDAAKKFANDLLARIFAYWTLLEIGDALSYDLNKKLVLKTPNPTQVLSIMMLLGFDKKDKFYQGNQVIKSAFDNQLIQILTGEGKSITLGVASIIFALLGLHVDVVCYSKYLSERDYESFKDIFQSFKVETNIYYGTIDQVADRMINNGGDIRQLTNALLLGQKLAKDSKTKHNSILLVDEVDVFFGESFYGNTYNPAARFCTPEIKQILIDIWSNKNQPADQLTKLIFSSNSYRYLIQNYGKWKKLLDFHITMAVADVKNINNPPYIVQNGMIGYKQHDGISFNTVHGYRTMYAYFQECENGRVSQQYRDEHIAFNISCGKFSYAEIPKMYKNILGVTGTLDSLHPEIKKVIRSYDIQKESFAPSMYGDSNLIFKKNSDMLVEDNEINWMMKIQRYTQEKINDKQSVLIFFETKKRLEKYLDSTFLIKDKNQYNIITEETEEKEHNIEQSTLSGTVTLLVRDFGRGTDFICLDDAVTKEGKGVVVIQTFLANDQSEENQIKGRTARQGQPGQYLMILLADDLYINFNVDQQQLQSFKQGSNIYETLNKIRNQIKSQQLAKQKESIQSATDKHNLTTEYKKALNNDENRAFDLLMKFNQVEKI